MAAEPDQCCGNCGAWNSWDWKCYAYGDKPRTDVKCHPTQGARCPNWRVREEHGSTVDAQA
jgi:hypothetical protein